MKWMKKALLFALGGGSYVGLELLWRRRSHPVMFLAGGTAFLLVGKLGKMLAALPRPVRWVAGAGAITATEFAAGCVFNRRWQIWDYRGLPGNYLGQICLGFSVLWIPLAAVGQWLYNGADWLLSCGERNEQGIVENG